MCSHMLTCIFIPGFILACPYYHHPHPIKVMVTLVQNGIGSLPFGAPVAALIGGIYSRAAQVSLLSQGAGGGYIPGQHR